MDLVKVVVWVGVAGVVAGMVPRTDPRDPSTIKLGLQAVRERRSPTPSSQVSPTTAAHLARRTALPRRRGLRRGGNTRQSTLSPNRVPTPAEKASKSGRRAVLRRLKVRRKRPPTTAAPQFLNERELVEPQKSLVFQATTPASALLPNIRVHQHSTVGIVPSPTPSPAPQPPSPPPPQPTPKPIFAPTRKPTSNFSPTLKPASNFASNFAPTPKPRQNFATEPSATPAPDFHHFPTPAVRFRPVEEEERQKVPQKEVQVQSIFKPLREKQPTSSFLPTAKPARPSRPRQGSARQGGRRRLRFRPSSAQRPQEPLPTRQPVTEAFQVLDAVPQQPEGVRSPPSFNSPSSSEQSFSSQSSFEEGFSSEGEGGSRSKQAGGDFQTIFGEFRPGQTFATLQSVGGKPPPRGSSINPQSSRIPPTPQTINQQRFEQNQIVEQPQRFRQPQRFEQNQRFEPAQIFEQPRTTAQPQRFEQPRTTAQPQRFEQPRTSVQPQRFVQPRTAQAQNFAQNQRFSPQQPSRSVQRFTPQLQNSEGEQRFVQRQQNNLNQFEQNKLNLASSSNLAATSNLGQNSFEPQQPVRQSSFQQDAFESFFSGSTFPPSFPAMETPRSGLQSDQRFNGHPASNFNMIDGSYSIFTIL